MKVGIITFHRARNYGAVLQAFALMTYITKNFKNADAKIIDYRCKFIEEFYTLRNPQKGIKNFIKYFLSKNTIKKRNATFQDFIDTKLKLSLPCDMSDIKYLSFDKYIAGSDMIWHWHTHEGIELFDDSYFLNFVDDASKKYSYASSFGTDKIPQKYNSHYRKLLADFQFISVRERSGIEIVKNLTGKESSCNIDPTLLFNHEDWKKIAIPPKENRYVILYEVGGISQDMKETAVYIAKKLKCKLITLFSEYDLKQYLLTKNGIFGFSPCEFLGWINNAEFVVTNSFHGTAFSIIFHKYFLSEINTWSKNNRSLELINLLQLQDRILDRKKIVIDNPIDWENVDLILDAERKKSFNLLEKSLNND